MAPSGKKVTFENNTADSNSMQTEHLKWQRFRKPNKKIQSVAFGLEYAIDNAISGTYSNFNSIYRNACSTDLDYFEGGISFNVEYSLNLMAVSDH